MAPEHVRAYLFYAALLIAAGLLPRETLLAELEMLLGNGRGYA